MSRADDLPEDPSRWPASVYELFGVDHSADQRTARRAYVQLIRRFKPEHYPEQFQRLRAAFEQLERGIAHRQMYERYQSEQQLEVEAIRLDHTQEELGEGATGDAREPATPRAPTLTEEIDQVWQTALTGDAELAYARGVSLWMSGKRSDDLAIRLYWLLFAAPEFDPHRTADDWLYEAVVYSRLEGKAAELYRQFVRREPLEAISERCTELLREKYSASAIVDFLPSRWRAAASIGKWSRIQEDLTLLRPRLRHDEAMWGRLLLAAIDELLWAPGDQAEPLLAEFEQVTHVGSEFYESFHWLDYKLEMLRGWHVLEYSVTTQTNWRRLLPGSFSKELEEMEPALSEVLVEIASEPPVRALAKLDVMHRESAAACNALGLILERAYDQRMMTQREHRSRRQIMATCETIFHLLHLAEFPRVDLLLFCLNHALDPRWVAQYAEEHWPGTPGEDTNWADCVAADGPLRYVYYARRACG